MDGEGKSERIVLFTYICTVYYINTIWSNRYRNFLLPKWSDWIVRFRLSAAIDIYIRFLGETQFYSHIEMQIFQEKKKNKWNGTEQYCCQYFLMAVFLFLSLACLKTHAHAQASWWFCYRCIHRLHHHCCCCCFSCGCCSLPPLSYTL